MKKLARFYILLSWSMFILIMISFPTPPYDGTVISWHDKVFHILLFGVFCYLMAKFLALYSWPKILTLAIAGLLATGYSLGGEYLQGFIPGRTVSIYDFYAGLAGIVLGLAISYVRFKRFKT